MKNNRRLLSISTAMLLSCTSSTTLLFATTTSDGAADTQDILEDEQKAWSVQTFLDTYAGGVVYTTSETSSSQKFVWFAQADENNFQIILEGYALFLKQPMEFQKQVRLSYKEQNLDYDILIWQASAVQEQIVQAAIKAREEQNSQDSLQSAQPAIQNPAAEDLQPSIEEANVQTAENAVNSQGLESLPQKEVPEQQKDNGSADAAPLQAENSAQNSAQQTPPSVADNSNELMQSIEKLEDTLVQSSPDLPNSPVLNVQTDSQVNSESEIVEDEAAEAQPESQEPEENAQTVVLLSSEIISGSSVVTSLYGQTGQLEEAVQYALDSWIEGMQLIDPVVYADSYYEASQNAMSTYLDGLIVVQNGESLYILSPEISEEAVSLHLFNPAVKTVSFTSDTFTLGLKDTFRYPLMVTEAENLPLGTDEDSSDSIPDQTADKLAAAGNAASAKEEAFLDLNQNGSAASLTSDNELLQKTEVNITNTASVSLKAESAAMQSNIMPQSSGIVYTQSTSAKAASFVSTYCSSSNGTVYRQATASNYKQILNGFSVWKTLDATTRSMINTSLKDKGGTSFQDLYVQANRIRLNMPLASSTDYSKTNGAGTAAKSCSMFYSLSTALFAFLGGMFAMKFHGCQKEEETVQ